MGKYFCLETRAKIGFGVLCEPFDKHDFHPPPADGVIQPRMTNSTNAVVTLIKTLLIKDLKITNPAK
jgi:hypothetical protein